MKQSTFIWLLVFILSNCADELFAGQTTISLQDCYNASLKHYPLQREFDLSSNKETLTQKKLTGNYLPQVKFNGKASAQSQVTEFPFDNLPLIQVPEYHHDNYQVSVNVEQLIYDGGSISAMKDMALAERSLNYANTTVALYNLRFKILDYYFGVLLSDEHKKNLNLLHDELTEKYRAIESNVKHGLLPKGASETILAEIKKTEQGLIETKTARQTALKSLSLLTGLSLDKHTTLKPPENAKGFIEENQFKRPEYKAFQDQSFLYQREKQFASTAYFPKLFAFFQGTYGRPGLDVFETEFSSYAVVGLQAQWTLWNWNQTGLEKELIDLKKEHTRIRKDEFSLNLSRALESQQKQIEKLKQLIKKDREIITLRENVAQQSSRQLDQGIISATEYLTELNKKIQATFSRDRHNLELIKAYAKLKLIAGEEL